MSIEIPKVRVSIIVKMVHYWAQFDRLLTPAYQVPSHVKLLAVKAGGALLAVLCSTPTVIGPVKTSARSVHLKEEPIAPEVSFLVLFAHVYGVLTQTSPQRPSHMSAFA